MNIIKEGGNASSLVRVQLQSDETLTAEAGSMVSMSAGIGISTTTFKKKKGGILKAMKRMLAGESFFLNHFTAHRGGEVTLAPSLSGDIVEIDLEEGGMLMVQGGSYLASCEGVHVETRWGGFKKGLFSGEDMFWIELTGQGKVLLSSFGAVYPIQVSGEYIVDTGHIVAYDEGLQFDITKAGGSWATAIFGGEGLVCRFTGEGTVWVQSHNPGAFGSALSGMLRTKKR